MISSSLYCKIDIELVVVLVSCGVNNIIVEFKLLHGAAHGFMVLVTTVRDKCEGSPLVGAFLLPLL